MPKPAPSDGLPRKGPGGQVSQVEYTVDQRAALDKLFAEYWAPLLADENGVFSPMRMKAELWDAYHVMDTCTKVFLHVTGGALGDPCASPEAVIALAERRVKERIDDAVNKALQEVPPIKTR